jgi:hypothetical protein
LVIAALKVIGAGYLIYLPQFVSPAARHPTVSMFALGVAFAALRGRFSLDSA